MQVDTDRYRSMQVDADRYRPDRYRSIPMHADTDRYRPIRAMQAVAGR